MQYTIGDVRRHKDPMNYVQTMILHAQGTKIPKDSYQLILVVYYHIDGLLQRIVPFLHEGFTIDNIAKMRKPQDVWFNTYVGHLAAPTAPFQHQALDWQVLVTQSAKMIPLAHNLGRTGNVYPQQYGIPGSSQGTYGNCPFENP